MVKKVLAVFSVIFCSLVLFFSTSKRIMNKITGIRENAPAGVWWSPKRMENTGDLVRMGYLDNVPQFQDTNIVSYNAPGRGNRKTNLYLFGDSYLMDVPETAFFGLGSYFFGRRDYGGLEYNLDSQQNNVLVIEIGERFFRNFFEDAGAIYFQVKRAEQKSIVYKNAYSYTPSVLKAGFSFSVDSLFNPVINPNIEYNLFTYNFLSEVRTFKAALNSYVFCRGSGNVVVSDDGKFLFIKESVMPFGKPSSYNKINSAEIELHIMVLNEVYQHYKKEGFDEVYLSIIPNTASMVQSYFYNNLIPEIENKKRSVALKMPLISVYKEFKNKPSAYYLKGDTHWTIKGKSLWLDKMNDLLKQWDQK